jgi:vacuolar-type H+-ATPase subunit H
MLAVPATGSELLPEVAPLFDELDEIERHREGMLAGARSDAAQTQRAAGEERVRLLAEARENAESRARTLRGDHRARARESRRALLAEADREAARVQARARGRTPALIEDIVKRLLEDGS